MISPKKIRDLTFCFISAILLILAFPLKESWILSWGALIPLMIALDDKNLKDSFWLGYVSGFIFFLGTMYWLIHVTLLGMLLMVVYLAVYFGLFGCGYYYFRNKSLFLKLFALPSWWVVLEYIRAHMLTGFDWGSLGYSQYKNLWMIQIADITGMYGISFLVVMLNVFIKDVGLARFLQRRDELKKSAALACLIVGSLLIFVGLYGFFKTRSMDIKSWPLSVAVVQANIPQEMKWKKSFWPTIMNRYKQLTVQVAREHPRLIIWPETSFPGFLWEDKKLFEELERFVVDLKIPLLVGAITEKDKNYFNSALLISAEGKLVQQYDKVHLVPFGEFIPFRSSFPFLSSLAPIADFTAGKEYSIFVMPSDSIAAQDPKPFAVLICFEDAVSELSRASVLNGAQWLVNMTNDAWFKDTNAPFLHLQASVFRAIENRRPVVRAANTGVSGFIDQKGRIIKLVQDAQGKNTFVAETSVGLISVNQEKTIYTQWGDIFVGACALLLLISIFLTKII